MKNEQQLSGWCMQVEELWATYKQSPWALGDMLLEGSALFTDGSKDEAADLYDLLSEQLSVSPKTLANYARISRSFPEEERWPELMQSHHETVMRFSKEVRHDWLQQAAEHGWTVSRLRVEISAGLEPDEPIPLPNPVAVERALWRAGVKATLTRHRADFVTPSGKLTVRPHDGELRWSTNDEEGDHED